MRTHAPVHTYEIPILILIGNQLSSDRGIPFIKSSSNRCAISTLGRSGNFLIFVLPGWIQTGNQSLGNLCHWQQ